MAEDGGPFSDWRDGPDWVDLADRDTRQGPFSNWPAAGPPRWPEVELTYLYRDGGHALAVYTTGSDADERLDVGVFTQDPREVWQLVAFIADSADIGEGGITQSCVYAWGKTTPHRRLHFRYGNTRQWVTANPDGWWAFLHNPDPTLGRHDYPELIS